MSKQSECIELTMVSACSDVEADFSGARTALWLSDSPLPYDRWSFACLTPSLRNLGGGESCGEFSFPLATFTKSLLPLTRLYLKLY